MPWMNRENSRVWIAGAKAALSLHRTEKECAHESGSLSLLTIDIHGLDWQSLKKPKNAGFLYRHFGSISTIESFSMRHIERQWMKRRESWWWPDCAISQMATQKRVKEEESLDPDPLNQRPNHCVCICKFERDIKMCERMKVMFKDVTPIFFFSLVPGSITWSNLWVWVCVSHWPWAVGVLSLIDLCLYQHVRSQKKSSPSQHQSMWKRRRRHSIAVAVHAHDWMFDGRKCPSQRKQAKWHENQMQAIHEWIRGVVGEGRQQFFFLVKGQWKENVTQMAHDLFIDLNWGRRIHWGCVGRKDDETETDLMCT